MPYSQNPQQKPCPKPPFFSYIPLEIIFRFLFTQQSTDVIMPCPKLNVFLWQRGSPTPSRATSESSAVTRIENDTEDGKGNETEVAAKMRGAVASSGVVRWKLLKMKANGWNTYSSSSLVLLLVLELASSSITKMRVEFARGREENWETLVSKWKTDSLVFRNGQKMNLTRNLIPPCLAISF